jgi:hypothetical protein
MSPTVVRAAFCLDAPGLAGAIRTLRTRAAKGRRRKPSDTKSAQSEREFHIPSPRKSMPINDFCGGCFFGWRSDLVETV